MIRSQRLSVKRIRTPIFLALIWATLLPAGRAQDKLQPMPLPFAPGEVLHYEVRWKPPIFFMPSVKAGLATLRVEPETSYEGARAMHFTASAQSDGLLPKLGGIDVQDSFDSVVSAEDFCSRRIVKIQREGKRKRDIVVVFNPEAESAHITETNMAFTPPRVTRNETLPAPPCVSDVLSIFYAARRMNLGVGETASMLLNDNATTRPVTVTAQEREEVETGHGPVAALRIHTGSAMGLISRGGTFVVWYSDDDLKIPVKFEASVRFGKIFGSLKSYEGPGKLRTVQKPGD